MRLCVLSSGSGGNCLWVEAGGARVLVDAGLPLRETKRRCAERGLDLRDATDVVLTHEHADHAGAAGVLSRKLGVRVHATRGTWRAVNDLPDEAHRHTLKPGEPLRLAGLTITPVAVPHDACEPVGYVFEDESGARAAIVTDLGSAPATVARELRDLHALIVEMNHDLRMLLEGPYPFRLKQRIRSDFGHLSNEQGARLIGEVLHRGLRHVVLAHLSEHNNTEDKARREAETVLSARGANARLHVGGVVAPLEPIELGPVARRAHQLALFG